MLAIVPIMRPQVSNSGQNSGSNDQKKSIFDRLGRQIDTHSGRSMKRRPSPGPYNDYMPPPSIHEAEFNPYPVNRDSHAQAELEWRYQNERRHMPPQFASRPDRHPTQLPPAPPPHYEMEMPGRQQSYYPHPPHPFISQPIPAQPGGAGIDGQPGNGPPPLGMQRSSPKYDRHGNPIMGFKDRGGPVRPNRPLDHHAMSPSRSFMPPGAMIPLGHEMNMHEMGPMRAAGGMYPPPQRWHEGAFETPEFPSYTNRIMRESRFSPIGFRRFQQQQMNNPQMPGGGGGGGGGGGEATRYTKWRERRDVITNLDRETAQSSSRTDSLKSSLQQPDNRNSLKKEPASSEPTKAATTKLKLVQGAVDSNTPATNISNEKAQVCDKDSSKQNTKASVKSEPQDISDGEIVDDEDSSDDSESIKTTKVKESGDFRPDKSFINRTKAAPPTSFARGRESQQYYDAVNKKRRMHEECSMDYETISDEDLDDFMDEKKISDIGTDEDKLGSSRISGEGGKNSVSEIELLNALGLDWANLVEMAKQSKTTETYSPGSALPRFSMPNYLPTLGISADLVGPEIHDLILKVCRS